MVRGKMMLRLVIYFGRVIFMLFLLGALLSLAVIESPGNSLNDGFVSSIKLLALPVGVIVFTITYFSHNTLMVHPGKPWQPWLNAVLLYPMLLLLSPPYVMAINALSIKDTPIIYSGPILEKFVHSGKSRSLNIRMQDTHSGKNIELQLSCEEYSKVAEGDPYCVAFNQGLLNMPFRWRYGSNPALAARCEKISAAIAATHATSEKSGCS